jgi:hypothetical protein
LKTFSLALLVCLASGLTAVCHAQGHDGEGLVIHYGDQGVENVAFQGQVVEDVSRWPDDRFHIWHMRCYNTQGKALTDGEYGWGENKKERSWDKNTKSWIYHFSWGTILATYVQKGDALDVRVTTTDFVNSGVILDGASIFPLALHLPGVGVETHIANDIEAPGVSIESWSGGTVTLIVPVAAKAIYSGFQAGKDQAQEVLVSGTRPDALPFSEEHGGRQVRPGETDSFTVSLRFSKTQKNPSSLAEDAYKDWAQRWPPVLNWRDRRIIGTAFLASSGQGDRSHPAGYATNPRRFFTDGGIDVKSTEGLHRFQVRVLEQAQTIVRNLKRMDAQGVVTWDIEGEEYPQDTSYVCSPDQIAVAAPEMESVLIDGPYRGMKVDDAYFKTIRDAGFKVGVCIRPQRFVLNADRTAGQRFLSDGEVAGELIRKMKYAHDRWGVTIFYLDSTVREGGATLPAAAIEEAANALPNSLLIPEESSPRMYRASAPFMSFIFHGETGTDARLKAYYPNAFGVNMVNDVDGGKLAAHRTELVSSVRGGDVLMVHADFWHPDNETVMAIYREASKTK